MMSWRKRSKRGKSSRRRKLVSKKTRRNLHRGGNGIPPVVPLAPPTEEQVNQSFLDTTTGSLGGRSTLKSDALVFQPTDPSEPSVPALMKVKNALKLKKNLG
jgi:hypothetical protein